VTVNTWTQRHPDPCMHPCIRKIDSYMQVELLFFAAVPYCSCICVSASLCACLPNSCGDVPCTGLIHPPLTAQCLKQVPMPCVLQEQIYMPCALRQCYNLAYVCMIEALQHLHRLCHPCPIAVPIAPTLANYANRHLREYGRSEHATFVFLGGVGGGAVDGLLTRHLSSPSLPSPREPLPEHTQNTPRQAVMALL